MIKLKRSKKILSKVNKKIRLSTLSNNTKPVGLLVILIISVIGVNYLIGSRAESPYVSRSANNGSLSGGSIRKNDSTVTGGKYVQFGSPVSTPPATPNPDLSDCLPDPTAQINALPAGSTFDGKGHCYLLSNGMQITASNITINGGLYVDPLTGPPPGYGFDPIIKLDDVSYDTLENLQVLGENARTGSWNNHAELVGEAGFFLAHAAFITMTNDAAFNTYGDCIEARARSRWSSTCSRSPCSAWRSTSSRW